MGAHAEVMIDSAMNKDQSFDARQLEHLAGLGLLDDVDIPCLMLYVAALGQEEEVAHFLGSELLFELRVHGVASAAPQGACRLQHENLRFAALLKLSQCLAVTRDGEVPAVLEGHGRSGSELSFEDKAADLVDCPGDSCCSGPPLPEVPGLT